jgi:tetratricopeptide (TPR) repeat protein
MDAAGLLLGVSVSVPAAMLWPGGSYATALALAAVAAVLAVAGGVLYGRRRRRARRAKPPPPDPAHALKERLRRRLAEPLEAFAPFAGAGPTVGAGEAVEGDLDAAAKDVLPEAGWRRGVAKHVLRQRLNGHALPGAPNGSETARWRQLGALALIDDASDALAAYSRAADLAPDDADLQMLLGGLYLRTGRLEVAEATFRRQLELAAGRDGAAPVRYRAGTLLGDVLLAKGERAAALAAYEAARKEALALAEREPDTPRWRRDASVAHDRIGDLLLADGQPEPALDCFRRSLEMCAALAKADPATPARQHDLSVAHDRIGEALDRKGDLDGALESYRHGLALAEAAAKLAPDRADWRWDVSASHDRIGDVLAAKGRTADALAAHRVGLSIAEALAAGDPTRLDWQRDLAATCHKIGLLEAQLGREAEAREALEQGKAIIARLAEVARYQAQWRADLARFNAALKGLGP